MTDADTAGRASRHAALGDPLYPGKRYEDWELADPAGQGIEAVRPIRDEIRGRVEGLLASLGVAAPR